MKQEQKQKQKQEQKEKQKQEQKQDLGPILEERQKIGQKHSFTLGEWELLSAPRTNSTCIARKGSTDSTGKIILKHCDVEIQKLPVDFCISLGGEKKECIRKNSSIDNISEEKNRIDDKDENIIDNKNYNDNTNIYNDANDDKNMNDKDIKKERRKQKTNK